MAENKLKEAVYLTVTLQNAIEFPMFLIMSPYTRFDY